MNRTRERVQREESREEKVDPQRGRGRRRAEKFLRTNSRDGNSGREPWRGEDVMDGRSIENWKQQELTTQVRAEVGKVHW